MSYELKHAERYAAECLDIFMFKHWLKTRPDIFKYASLKVRPATRADYYVPPNLVGPDASVVESTSFDEIGCSMVACFPFDVKLKPCKGRPSWIRLGEGFSVACQHACEWSSIDTEFRGGRCLVANPLKKLLATAPEEYMNMKARQLLHTGLDLVDGHLKLNRRYCESFGTTFVDGECTVPTGQYIAEILLGTTVYRTIVAGYSDPTVSLPSAPSMPGYLTALPPHKRIKRSPPFGATKWSPNDEWKQTFREIATDVSIDLGIDVSLDYVSKVLRKRVPNLLRKAAIDVPIKCALARAVIVSHSSTLANISKFFGKGLKTVNLVLFVYGILSIVLDAFDPFEYNRVLTKAVLDDVDRQLDTKYFQRFENFDVEVTPKYLFEITLDEDESDRWQYYADCIRAYLVAMRSVPEESRPKTKPSKTGGLLIRHSRPRWMHGVRIAVVLLLLMLAFAIPDRVHLFGLTIFVFLFKTRQVS